MRFLSQIAFPSRQSLTPGKSWLSKIPLLSVLLLCFSLASPGFAAEQALVNINTADAETLVQVLKGVGPSKARAIVEYRETYGQFEAIEELQAVKGIGPSIVDKNRNLIVLE